MALATPKIEEEALPGGNVGHGDAKRFSNTSYH
jgi:hypothetical protein